MSFRGFAATSREAYAGLQLGDAQMRVYVELLKGGRTCREIADALEDIPSNITGRLSELAEMGLVRQFGKRECTVTGKKAFVWSRVGVQGGQRTLL